MNGPRSAPCQGAPERRSREPVRSSGFRPPLAALAVHPGRVHYDIAPLSCPPPHPPTRPMPPALLALCLFTPAAADPPGPDGDPREVVATVAEGQAAGERGGEPITRGRVHLFLDLRGVPAATRPAVWPRAVSQVAEQARMRRFLEGRRAFPPPDAIDRAVKNTAAKLGGDPSGRLAELGLTDAAVREEAVLPLAWGRHARRAITDEAIRAHFAAHRRRFDGTLRTVSHILVRGDDAGATLERLKGRIGSGELTFAAAAKQFSEAPTAAAGGSVGPVLWNDGTVPRPVSDAAFAAEVGTVVGPVASGFGTHLVLATDETPGDVALEDVREAVFDDLADTLWRGLVARQR